MSVIADLVSTLYALVCGIVDVALGRHRKRYVTSIDIKASLEDVWAAVSALSIVFEGPPRIEIAVRLKPGSKDVYEGTVTVGNRVVPMAYREIEMRPREGLLVEILQEGSAPTVAMGHDYYVACTLKEIPGGTQLTMVHELTHAGFLSRILVPVGARQNARRLRDYCEAAAGTAGKRSSSKLGAALVTAALTYASFIYLFDWKFAAVLLALLVIHESGHAIAMRWVGLPVQGVYFIPFFGGIAVSAAPHRSEAERGFVALMGPGFSLLTTGAFLIGAFTTGNPLFEQLALVSAILNGLNLAPVLPLDGGQVADAALSASDPEFAAIINMLALIIGVGVAVYLEWHVLTVLLLLTAPMLLKSRKGPRRAEPITETGRNWLIAGYVATVAFYIAVVAHYMA
ncbi:site-2 protease family protein [Hyphomicrobium sp.]|uniref:site-2 protease family protein n=1 Tax=Hyphomicrobium sp. TaxID=82 RepID=UPI002E2EE88F|nr:site-2 protease family protein [Hyphomicrobium sp.]HEX2840886.1 site-2 protease family protein [Hyphomicrobium sp.]